MVGGCVASQSGKVRKSMLTNMDCKCKPPVDASLSWYHYLDQYIFDVTGHFLLCVGNVQLPFRHMEEIYSERNCRSRPYVSLSVISTLSKQFLKQMSQNRSPILRNSVIPVWNYLQHGLLALDIRSFTLYLPMIRVNGSHCCDVQGDWEGNEVFYSGSYWGNWPSININSYQCCHIQFRYNNRFSIKLFLILTSFLS